jgi:hypothetical protein
VLQLVLQCEAHKSTTAGSISVGCAVTLHNMQANRSVLVGGSTASTSKFLGVCASRCEGPQVAKAQHPGHGSLAERDNRRALYILALLQGSF